MTGTFYADHLKTEEKQSALEMFLLIPLGLVTLPAGVALALPPAGEPGDAILQT